MRKIKDVIAEDLHTTFQHIKRKLNVPYTVKNHVKDLELTTNNDIWGASSIKEDALDMAGEHLRHTSLFVDLFLKVELDLFCKSH